ncbi:MAG: metalloregulator ArsR/SmtB family transcription factor [Gemmatimonadota bacterium]
MALDERALLEHDDVENTARVLKCLGHPLRLRILDLLEWKSEATVTEVHEALDIGQAVASQHLTTMRDKGILASRKEGVHVIYRIGDERAVKVLSCVRESAC